MNNELRRWRRLRIASFFFLPALLVALLVAIATDPVWKIAKQRFGFGQNLDPESDFVRFLDVGQGDCFWIHSNGRSALIDAGPVLTDRTLLTRLKRYGLDRIDVLFLSHYDADHAGGAADLLNTYPPSYLVLPGRLEQQTDLLPDLSHAVHTVRKGGCILYTARPGLSVCVGNFTVTVLYHRPESDDSNAQSVVLMAEADGIRFLLTGDLPAEAESLLLQEGLDLRCDVLKVAHHGSGDATSEALLQATSPQYAVISCGKNNLYSHPHEETLLRLEKHNVTICRTDREGDLTFSVQNGTVVRK